MEFEKNSFSKRVKSMLAVDFKRAFTQPLAYLSLLVALVIPVLILVMTTMMDGSVTTDHNGNQTVMKGFENVWQILGSVSTGGSTGMQMDLTSMCNVNMMYFLIAVFVCVFVGEDFRSGYAKNLFTVRAKKTDYILSKTAVCFCVGGGMILAFTLGSFIGGGASGLSFAMEGFHEGNLVASVVTKTFLALLFVPLYLTMSVVAKSKVWLSVLLSLVTGMFLYTVAPMVAPLDANFGNVLISLVGGLGFAFGLGAISVIVLKKTSLA